MSSPPQAELTELARRYEEGKRALSDGNYKKAIRMFDKALRSYNSDKDCQHDKAVLCCARSAANFFWKKHDEAITDAETAISISPTWSKGFFRKAEPLAELHRRNEAMENYRKAKSLV